MKHTMIKSFSAFCAVSLFFLSTAANAQRINVWKGGTPGHETDWKYYKNWTLGKTPNEFDHVLIPDVSTTTRAYPVVANTEVEITSLQIQPGAMLTVLPTGWIQTDEFNNAGDCNGCNTQVKIIRQYGIIAIIR